MIKLAGNKYQLLKEKNEWDAPSVEEEKILALQAQIHKLQKKGRPNKGKNQRNTGRNDTRRSTGERGNGKWDPKPSWMLKRPKQDELQKPKTWNGKQWWYCSHETGGKCEPGTYRRHKPKDCKGNAVKRRNQNPEKEEEKKNEEESEKPNKKIKLSAALAAVADENDTSEEDSDEGYES